MRGHGITIRDTSGETVLTRPVVDLDSVLSMSGSQYDDVADRVEEAVRAYVVKRMPRDPVCDSPLVRGWAIARQVSRRRVQS